MPMCLLPYMENMVTLERDSLASQKRTVTSLKEEMWVLSYCVCDFSCRGQNLSLALAIVFCEDYSFISIHIYYCRALFTQGAFYYVARCSNLWLCEWDPKVWLLKWKLLSSTFLWDGLLCRQLAVGSFFWVVVEIVKCDHTDEKIYRTVLSCGAVNYALQVESNFSVCECKT